MQRKTVKQSLIGKLECLYSIYFYPILTLFRLKTGNVPPLDFVFEELTPGMEVKTNVEKRNTMSRGRSKQALNAEKGTINYFQRKRELEKIIEAQESEVLKGKFEIQKIVIKCLFLRSGQKEMKSLQLMIQTYTQNPKFGDVKKFQGELDAAAHKVQLLESELHAMQTELVDVNDRLENMRNQSPAINKIRRERSPSGSLASSMSSTQVSVESACNTDSEWEEDDLSAPSAPPEESISRLSLNEKVVASFSFESDSSDTIPMAEGEEFFLMEEDQDGWTKVKRVDNRFFEDMGEGFVPTSYIQSL